MRPLSDGGQEPVLLLGEDYEARHQENHSENNKERVACALPARRVVEHLGRLQEHK